MRTFFNTALVVTAMLLFASSVFGGGIEAPQQNARASGQAEAFAAQADDASAIFYNPSGLTQIRGTSATVGASVFIPDFAFHSNTGQEQGQHLVTVLPHLYAESDFGTERWRFGLGITNPFGLNENWGNRGPLRTLIDDAQLLTVNFAPTVAYTVSDNFSVGVAANVYYGNLYETRNVILAAPPVPEGRFHFRGDDYAFGVTPSMLWKINEQNTIGLVYRSPFKMSFDGNASVKTPGIPEFGPSDTHANFNFPQMATLAYAFRPVKPLKLEADVVWTDWNVVNSIKLYSADPHFNGVTFKEDWKSGFGFRFGGQYDLTENWALRAGYAFGQNAVPGSTFSPIVPDSNYHLFAVGVGYSSGDWSIDAAYQFIYREKRHISNSISGPAVNGTWDNIFNSFMVTYTLKV